MYFNQQEGLKKNRILYFVKKILISMGTISSNSGLTDYHDESNQSLKLAIDPQKSVKQQLKQLLSWSLSQIRQIYAPFRRRKSSPILTRSQFLRFINLSRITSFYIYDNISKYGKTINVFEIMAILVLTAHTNYIYKVQFLFNVFDLSCNKVISFSQLILLFKSIVRGFCFLTDQKIPTNQLLQRYGHAMFSKADLNNDQLLEIGQIIGWLQNSSENLILFKEYEPQIYGTQDYHIFNSFVPYTSNQINQMIKRINKLYHSQKIEEQDYLLLKPILKSKNNKQNINTTLSKAALSTLTNQRNIKAKNASKSPLKKSKKFENIIIIKGKTITKKQVFQLRQYFDGMSSSKRHILIEDFIQSFNQQKYNHMKSIAASLFNFLDKKQNGKIDFLDLVTKLYPNLTKKHLQIISQWSQEYNRNFNIDKKIKANRDTQQIKKRVLPKTCIPRIQELFSFFDTESKGYVSKQNVKNILGNSCSDEEIDYLFTSSDQDKDGKLTLKQFVRILLPPDLQIEGLA